ncbi:ribonuclease H-like domain-containing protein [Phyllosticta citricarpa]|uniref:Ribonuclease n=2 Tax=Phyllosticta TaxID=121621 RepID=A0ABR1MQ64_9PEZI
MDDQIPETQDISLETPVDDVFRAPSVHAPEILNGASYSHFSPLPQTIASDLTTECVLGVDEAGRGPVLGPMVYALLYLPLSIHRSLLAETHHFDDSKVLTPAVRSDLMEKLCTPGTDLHQNCGWATTVMSARDISAGMLKPNGTYNLNAQAMDATIDLIKQVLAKSVNVKEVYIDTIGSPAAYQKKLERIFPTVKITVAKKADSLYPCVSAASVCAKVTRDAALDVSYEAYKSAKDDTEAADGWGSGYPSDARCSSWLKRNKDPLFGWGPECRFSWGTAKDLLEDKKTTWKVDWPVDDDAEGMNISSFFSNSDEAGGSELSNWYGRPVTEEIF